MAGSTLTGDVSCLSRGIVIGAVVGWCWHPPLTSHASCDQTPIASRASHNAQTSTAADNQTANKPILQPKAWHQPGKHTSPKQNTTSPWAKMTPQLTPKVENYSKIIPIYYRILSQNVRMPNRHTEYFQLLAGTRTHNLCNDDWLAYFQTRKWSLQPHVKHKIRQIHKITTCISMLHT